MVFLGGLVTGVVLGTIAVALFWSVLEQFKKK
jgi:hypothetical protein